MAERFWSRLVMAGCVLAAVGCGRCEVPSPQPLEGCRPLARVVGPEDFDFDGGRLLVSSQDRRNPEEQGAIYAVELESRRVLKLGLRGRGDCSFHPHGIFLWQAPAGENGQKKRRLYVINHHEERDATAERACFPAGHGRLLESSTSVEVFEVEKSHLRFVERLVEPEILTNANDLVVDGRGAIYLTVPPAGMLGKLSAMVGRTTGGGRSKVVRYRRDETGRATWSTLTGEDFPARFVNGIALLDPRDRVAEGLVVSETFGEWLYLLKPRAVGVEAGRDRSQMECREGDSGWESCNWKKAGVGLDNLMWVAQEDPTVLLAAAHAELRPMIQHFASPLALSPSAVWKVPREGEPGELRRDEGGTISAASTAACHGGRLLLGQVFGGEILSCGGEGLCPEKPPPAPRSTGQAAEPPAEEGL